MEVTDSERNSGIVLNFLAKDDGTKSSSSSSSQDTSTATTQPSKLPWRLRRRLLQSKTPIAADDIESKLSQARLRRQQIYELKARPKFTAPCWFSSQEEDLARRLESKFNAAEQKCCWRQFVGSKKATSVLAKAFKALEINEVSVRSMPFEQLALQIESATTIQTTKALLDHLENHYLISWVATGSISNLENIEHLLKLVSSQVRRGRTKIWRNGIKNIGSSKEAAQSHALLRYPVRVLLCAYVILGHPYAIFSGRRELENALAESATTLIQEFELLIEVILHGPIQKVQEDAASSNPSQVTFRSQLEAFDKAWCSYLHHFVAWKENDAKLLEDNLVRAACQLELFKMQTCMVTSVGEDGNPIQDKQPIQKQVTEDQKLLKENMQHVSGKAGIERMESVISDTLSKYFDSKKFKSSSSSSTSNNPSSSLPVSLDDSSVSAQVSNPPNKHESSSSMVHSLFGKDESSLGEEVGSSPSLKVSVDDHLSSAALLVVENELFVNKIFHEHQQGFTDTLNDIDEDDNSVTAKVKEIMEKAFWDVVMESIKEDDSDFGWILKLMREVRDELCDISSQSWKQEIVETIDIDIHSQVLRSGHVDIHYFRRILEFALLTLRKISAPANDEEMKTSQYEFLEELEEVFQAEDRSKSSCALAITKGLRFVLQQIQTLKREISKARLKLVEPLIKGPAGLEYLRKAFTNRHGSPMDAFTSLSITRQWLSSVKTVAEQEWSEFSGSLFVMTDNRESTQGLAPTTLRTGGNIIMGKGISSEISSPTDIKEQPECRGETVDLFVRLGLLKLVSEVGGLTPDALPETLGLNLAKLRAVQSQL